MSGCYMSALYVSVCVCVCVCVYVYVCVDLWMGLSVEGVQIRMNVL